MGERFQVPESELRAEWHRLRMIGSPDEALTHPHLRRALEASARARAARVDKPSPIDFKRLAAGDSD